MRGYLNLFILGYLPWLIVDGLATYFTPLIAVLISLVIIVPFVYGAVKERDYISLVFVSGFLAYIINLLFHIAIFALYAKNILLIVGVLALLSVILGKPFTILYSKSKVSPEIWGHPIFIKINKIISLVWAGIFLTEYIFRMINLPHYPMTNIVLIVAGVVFSDIFPGFYRKNFRAPGI